MDDNNTIPRPQNHKELFNHRHARLLNVIEHIFGVVKHCFRVLLIVQEYLPEIQSRLISGVVVIHNIIHIYDPTDTLEDTELEMESLTAKLAEWSIGSEEQSWASERREAIALAMWDDYWRRHRGRRACCA